MQLTLKETEIPGCYEIVPKVIEDDRGIFVKTFHQKTFKAKNLCTDWQEEYYSVSRRGVLRGLHFQTPPQDHNKLVYCSEGNIVDAVLDLRQGSPTFCRHFLVELCAEKRNML
ncbi:MAG: dTDP-4-dehydrorhamnose 3,5-epimerase family protein, partial [Proteobacteria bacterium]|nr:dTDP-4-dehydrorhamnose 3,5-epimerase family protein [Pseudomonadota bacterium]